MLRQSLIALTYGCLLTVSSAAVARYDPVTAAGHRGEDAGDRIRDELVLPTYEESDTNPAGAEITMPSGRVIEAHRLIPGADAQEAKRLESLPDDKDLLIDAGTQHTKSLESSDTASARTYRLTGDTYRQASGPDGVQQDFWQLTVDAMSNTQALEAVFGDCEVTTAIRERAQIPTYTQTEHTCEVMTTTRPSASRSRDLRVDHDESRVVSRVNYIGLTRDRVWRGNLIDDLRLNEPGSGSLAAVDNIEVTWSGTVADVVVTEPPSAANQYRYRVSIQYDQENPDPQQVRASLRADTTLVWNSVSPAADDLLMTSDNFCTARWTCTNDRLPTELSNSDIDPRSLGLELLYPTDPLNTPPSSVHPKICMEATANYDCNFNLGSMGCWIAPDGTRQCHTNTIANTVDNNCTDLRQDNQCEFKRRVCQEGATGFLNQCYVETETYSCREELETTEVYVDHSYSCDSALRCMGGECATGASHTTDNTGGRGFIKAQAGLTLIQHLTSDVTTNPDGSQELMSGRPYECRKSLGGPLDCCSPTAFEAEGRYMDVYASTLRKGNAGLSAAGADHPESSSSVMNRGDSQWDLSLLDKPFFSATETMSHEVNERGAVPEMGSSYPTLQTVMDDYRLQTHDAFVESGQTYQCTSEELDLAIQREAGACLHIGAYCPPAPSGTGSCVEKRDVYCCYNSALSRIVQESFLDDLADFGTPTAPKCPGLPTSIITSGAIADMPMDEWIGRMEVAGVLPDEETVLANSGMGKLTGDGSSLAHDDDILVRPDVLSRSIDALRQVPVRQVHRSVMSHAESEIPSAFVTEETPGVITLAPSRLNARGGNWVGVRVKRYGSQGSVSVSYRTLDQSARAQRDYIAQTGRLTWPDGDDSERVIYLETKPFHADEERTFRLEISDATGGAQLGAASDALISLGGSSTHAQIIPEEMEGVAAVTHLETELSVEGVYLTFETSLENTGSSEWPHANFGAILPAGFQILDVDVASPDTEQRCVLPGGDLDAIDNAIGDRGLVFCSIYNGVAPPSDLRLRIRVFSPDLTPRTVAAQCFLEYMPRSIGLNISQCIAAVTIEAQTQWPPHIEQCINRGAYEHGYEGVLTEWPWDVPRSGFSLGLSAPYGAMAAIEFEMSDHEDVVRITQQSSLNEIYMRISPCPFDLSLPTSNSDVLPIEGDVFAHYLCTNVWLTGFDEILKLYGINITATPDVRGCPLEPGKTYYLNIVYDDPEDQIIDVLDTTCDGLSCTNRIRMR